MVGLNDMMDDVVNPDGNARLICVMTYSNMYSKGCGSINISVNERKCCGQFL